MTILVWLTSHGVAVDSDVLVGALALAFVTQTILGWMKITSLEGKVKGLQAGIEELQDIHPRRGNPGPLSHTKGDQQAKKDWGHAV